MAPVQVKLRKAIDAFKDQTSISIAKVSSSSDPDLDVAVLKATSHDEVPTDEKYVQEILAITDGSRFNVSACVSALARRLSKTHNWIVAIKTLMLAHRLLCDGDPAFLHELSMSGRRGMRVLSASDFRDESHSSGWDFSAFVRSYGLYLDERMDCVFGSIAARSKSDRRTSRRPYKFEYSDDAYYALDGHGSDRGYRPGHDGYGSKHESGDQKLSVKLVKDMQPQELMEGFSVFQRMLEQLLACRPTGPAKVNRLVQIALYPIVRESFLLYTDVRDGLAILQDAFFDMDQRESDNIFGIFTRVSKQVDELVGFYDFCKTLGVCRQVEYPHVEKISVELLETMGDCLRNASDAPRGRLVRSVSAEPRRDNYVDNDASYDYNGIKALPAPPTEEAPAPAAARFVGVPAPAPAPVMEAGNASKHNTNLDGNGAPLINVKEPAISSAEHENKLAVALFSGTTESKVNTKWETFDQDGSDNAGKAGWELALVETESDISKPSAQSLAGGFDNLLLDSLYEHGTYRQKVAAAMNPVGSASSVALPGRAQSSFLALPAPPAAAAALQEDPFAASVSVPPPAYVQMAEMRQKQQLVVQEQQLWMQYQQQGGSNVMKLPTNPYRAPGAATMTQSTALYYSPNPYYY